MSDGRPLVHVPVHQRTHEQAPRVAVRPGSHRGRTDWRSGCAVKTYFIAVASEMPNKRISRTGSAV